MTVARSLIEPEGDSNLEMQLSIFMRDEMNHWFTSQHKASQLSPDVLRESVQSNSELVVKRASALGGLPTVNNLPANQTVVDLVSVAVDPRKLSAMDPLWMGYL